MNIPFIIAGGDFNLPGWDRKNKILKLNATYVDILYRFGDILIIIDWFS